MLQGLSRAGLWVLGIVAAVLLWEVACRAFAIPHYILPPPSAIYAQASLYPKVLAQSVGITMLEAVLGFVGGSLIGFLVGVVFFHVRILERMFFPYAVVSQTIPLVALGSIIVLWFGNSMWAKIVIAFYLTFFPVTVNTLVGLRSTDQGKIDLLRSFGASRWTMFWRVLLPAALPTIFVSLRLGAGLSLIGAIVGEWFGASRGVGVLLLQSLFDESMPRLWLAIVCAAIMGTVVYGAIALIETRFGWWVRVRSRENG